MKRNKKEAYKIGSRLIKSIKVPLIRSHKNKATGQYEPHIEHYKHNSVRNMPIKKADGTFGNKQIRVIAGQVRMRHARTFSEVKQYYGYDINSTISNVENHLESHYFSDSIANSVSHSTSSDITNSTINQNKPVRTDLFHQSDDKSHDSVD